MFNLFQTIKLLQVCCTLFWQVNRLCKLPYLQNKISIHPKCSCKCFQSCWHSNASMSKSRPPALHCSTGSPRLRTHLLWVNEDVSPLYEDANQMAEINDKLFTLKPLQSKAGVMVHACYLSGWKVEVGESWVQGQPPLHTKFKLSMTYIRSCFKTPARMEIKQINRPLIN